MATSSTRSVIIRELTASLGLLAAPASEQKQYLEELGTYPSVDELALHFGDYAYDIAVANGYLNAGQDELCRSLSSFLIEMSSQSNSDFWHDLHHAKWKKVRVLAQATLRKFP